MTQTYSQLERKRVFLTGATGAMGQASIQAVAYLKANHLIVDDPYKVPELTGPSNEDTTNPDITLYAVWQAQKVDFAVEVWVVRGDGRIEHLKDQDVHGVAAVGDTLDYTDPVHPIESWGTGSAAEQLALASLGYLAGFVGMLTDSRSFLSYPRHEYFRRILCRIFGEWVEQGFFPEDMDTLKGIVADISYNNARKYFNFQKKEI